MITAATFTVVGIPFSECRAERAAVRCCSWTLSLPAAELSRENGSHRRCRACRRVVRMVEQNHDDHHDDEDDEQAGQYRRRHEGAASSAALPVCLPNGVHGSGRPRGRIWRAPAAPRATMQAPMHAPSSGSAAGRLRLRGSGRTATFGVTIGSGAHTGFGGIARFGRRRWRGRCRLPRRAAARRCGDAGRWATGSDCTALGWGDRVAETDFLAGGGPSPPAWHPRSQGPVCSWPCASSAWVPRRCRRSAEWSCQR